MSKCGECEHWQKVKGKRVVGQCKNKNSFFYNLFLHAKCNKTKGSGCYQDELYRGNESMCIINWKSRENLSFTKLS